MEKPWTCLDCGARHPDSDFAVPADYRSGAAPAPSFDCKRCGQGPLLDARSPEVRTRLAESDQNRAVARERLLTWAAVPLGIVPVLGLVYLAPALFLLIPFLPIPFGQPLKAL